ncbi:hypothetical protein JCM10207_001920 [Rhodosporidiobolus poonsookiae]
MPLPDLNADVLAVIVQHAGSSAAASGDSPTSRFSLRSATLRRLCLVNSLWRAVAQPELDREVLVTPPSYAHVQRAFSQRRDLCRRVRRLEAVKDAWSGGWAGFDLRKLDPFVELFDELEELHCEGWPLALESLSGTKSQFGHLTAAHFTALARASTDTLAHLALGELTRAQSADLCAVLPMWFPSLRTLDMGNLWVSASLTSPLLPHLDLLTRLERLSLSIPHIPHVLPFLPTSRSPASSSASPAATPLRALSIRPGRTYDWDDLEVWDEHLPCVVEALEAGRLARLEELHLHQLAERWPVEEEEAELSRAVMVRLADLAVKRGFRLLAL